MKLIQTIFFIIISILGISAITDGLIFGGLLLIILGIIGIPAFSEKLKNSIPFWAVDKNRRSILIGGTILSLIIIGASLPDKNEDEENSTQTDSQKKEGSIQTEVKNKIFDLNQHYYDENGKEVLPDSSSLCYSIKEVLKHEKNEARESQNNWENISLVVTLPREYSEIEMKQITEYIKSQYAEFAPNNANVELWLDKKAYMQFIKREQFIASTSDQLLEEFQRTRIPINDKLEKIKKKYDQKNYQFIADNLIAYSALDGTFFYFMLKDSYYDEIVGK